MIKKRIFNLVLCLICIVTMVMPGFCTVNASIADVKFDLTSLGVLDGVDTDLPLEEAMTRAEFAKLVVNAMGYDDLAQTLIDRGYFGDLGSTPYVGEINLLYELKVLSGTGLGTFSPDAYVTYPQVGKIMVNVLGYSNIVRNTDLSSYYYLASTLGVYDDTDTSREYVNRHDAYIMIHNCLDVNIMTTSFGMYGSGSYEVQEGNTLKSYLSTVQHYDLTKMRGIVTADNVTYFYYEYGKNKDNIIEIDGKTYTCNFDVPRDLVGMAVDFYVEYTDDENGIVTAIVPSEKNIVTNFNLMDFAGVSSDEIKYYNGNDEFEVKYDLNTKLIYNGRRDSLATPADIVNYKNGTVKTIDNNEDGICDVIYVYEYNDAVVNRLYTETKQVYFSNNTVLNGARYVSLNDEEFIVSITDSKGNSIKFEEIPLDSVISIAKSKDNKVVTAVVSDKKITDKVNIIEDDYATIGTDVFKMAPGLSITLGTHVDAYVNFMGTLVYVDETISYDNYAYVLKVSGTNNLDPIKVALITPGYISEKSEETFSEEGGKASTSNKLFFRNTGKKIYEITDTVTLEGKRTGVNGQNYSASAVANAVLNQVVSYTVNSNGQISNFNIIEPYDSDKKKTYYDSAKVFSNGSGDGFGISDSATMSMCVPTNISSATDDDLKVPVMLLNATEYDIRAYDVDETTHIAGLVVITEDMKAGLPGNVTSSSDVAIVKKVSRKVINGEESLVVNMFTSKGEKNYTVSPLIPNVSDFLAVDMGDLVAYSLIEGNDELNGISILQDANNYYDVKLSNANSDKEACLGTVVDARYDYVSQTKGRWTDEITINYGSSTISYEIYNVGTPPIFLLEDSNKIKAITFDDIQIGDKIFVSSNYGAVRAMVVRR